MSPSDSMDLLESLVRRELEDLRSVREAIARYEKALRATSDEAYRDALALNLQSFYTGMEKILERIAREIDEIVPTGPEWHKDLLLQMSTEFRGRPPVISRPTLELMDEYRSFRHVVRNLYPFSLNMHRLLFLAERSLPCLRQFEREILAFLEGLRDAGKSSETET
jgi:hypothetical protein